MERSPTSSNTEPETSSVFIVPDMVLPCGAVIFLQRADKKQCWYEAKAALLYRSEKYASCCLHGHAQHGTPIRLQEKKITLSDRTLGAILCLSSSHNLVVKPKTQAKVWHHIQLHLSKWTTQPSAVVDVHLTKSTASAQKMGANETEKQLTKKTT